MQQYVFGTPQRPSAEKNLAEADCEGADNEFDAVDNNVDAGIFVGTVIEEVARLTQYLCPSISTHKYT